MAAASPFALPPNIDVGSTSSASSYVADETKELRAQLRLMNMRDICNDTAGMSMTDILSKMSQTKERHSIAVAEKKRERQQQSRSVTPHSGLGSPTQSMASPKMSRSQFSPVEGKSVSTGFSRRSPSPIKHDFSIARFRSKSPIWEACLHPDPEIEKTLYRTPCFDCTGKNMSSMGREEAKGCVVWAPPETDRSIPAVTTDSCSTTFRKQLTTHVERQAASLEEQYARMPSRTEKERNLKAKAGADLFNLQQVRDRVLQGSGSPSSPGRSRSPGHH
jgi:hypothetical protein